MKHDKGWKANKDTDRCGITNADRAARVEELFDVYTNSMNKNVLDVEIPDYCSDMIADLLHLAASNGWNAERVLRIADMNFQAER